MYKMPNENKEEKEQWNKDEILENTKEVENEELIEVQERAIIRYDKDYQCMLFSFLRTLLNSVSQALVVVTGKYSG